MHAIATGYTSNVVSCLDYNLNLLLNKIEALLQIADRRLNLNVYVNRTFIFQRGVGWT